MSIYRIPPIVLGTKEFDKGMMTYPHDYGRPFTIPPGPHVNTYEAYDILGGIKERADIILPLHEPKFANMKTICSRTNRTTT